MYGMVQNWVTGPSPPFVPPLPLALRPGEKGDQEGGVAAGGLSPPPQNPPPPPPPPPRRHRRAAEGKGPGGWGEVRFSSFWTLVVSCLARWTGIWSYETSTT